MGLGEMTNREFTTYLRSALPKLMRTRIGSYTAPQIVSGSYSRGEV